MFAADSFPVVETPPLVAAAGNPWRKFSPLATTEYKILSRGQLPLCFSPCAGCALPENLSIRAQLSVFSSSFDFLRHQTSNNRTSPSSGHSTVGSTIRRRIPTRFHHTHTHTGTHAHSPTFAGSTQFFPFLCSFAAFLQGTTFFFASSATFFLSQVTTATSTLHFFTGGFYLPAGPRRRNIHGSGQLSGCHKLCFFFYQLANLLPPA